MPGPTPQPDASTRPEPVRHGVAERLMLADIASQLLGGGRDVATKVGRFVLLEEIGAGGMGRVFRAYDPELDRSLALKVMRREAGDVESATMRLRVEAIALAKLNHPNVVTIHEVQLVGDELILAMELVDGQDLGQWAKRHPAPRPFVEDDRFLSAIGYLRQAATGLAAAHAAGLVHRDFKPSNVLVGDDGRVRVADFGLARAATDRAPTAPEPAREGSLLATRLTSTGRVSGTPRYMSLEQQEGLTVDARADQFAFCVTAWEVLFGDHPWGGAIPARTQPPPPVGAPTSLVRALLQGLAVDSAERHASMDALLRALPSERPRRSNVRTVAFAAGSAAAITAVAVAIAGAPDPCTGAADRLRGIWDDARRHEVREVVLGSGVPYAAAAWEQLEHGLNAYAAGWIEAHAQTCEATEVRREQSSEMMDAKMSCLAQRRRALAAFVGVVAEGTPGAIERAALGAADLPRIESCRDDDYAMSGFETPTGSDAAEVDALRDVLAESAALRSAGEYERARDLLEVARPRVEALAFPPLRQDFAYERARVASDLEEWRVEADALLQAYTGAARSGRTALAAEAASLLAVAVAFAGEHEGARRWLAVAEAALPDTPDPELSAGLADDRGDVELLAGDLEAAAAAYRESLAALEREHGPDDPRLVNTLRDLGIALTDLGRFDESRETLDRALALARRLGDAHPLTASVLWHHAGLAMAQSDSMKVDELAREILEILRATYRGPHASVAAAFTMRGRAALALGRTREALEWLAEADGIYSTMNEPEQRTERAISMMTYSDALSSAGRLDEAAAEMESALALFRAALPPGHPEIASALHNLGNARREQGRAEEALRLHEEARDLLIRRLGPDHPNLVAVAGGMSAALIDLERYPEAIAALERQLEIVASAFGPDSGEQAQPLYNLGLCQEALGDIDKAASSYAASLAVIEKHAGPDDPTLAFPLTKLSDIALTQGRTAEALAYAEPALAVQADGDAKLRADAQARVAQALWASGRDRRRARTLADEATTTYHRLGKEAEAQLDRLQTWRAKHGL
jgi:tetratricopeptide (TPR) repeat protein/tRNA A-37 threonylcarbamoyl transferase component Bud32